MADWKRLAMSLALADGKIDDTEVKVFRKELYEDGKIDNDEIQFLKEVRILAQKKAKTAGEEVNPAFEKFFAKALEDYILEDGNIDAKEAGLLREIIYADKKVDDNEKKLIARLNKAAKTKSPSFTKLFDECMGK
jgi:uncharacterized tellurite resistance protein B-like protein